MAETQKIISSAATGAEPIAMGVTPWAGGTADIQPATLRNPGSGDGLSVIASGTAAAYGLGVQRMDGSAIAGEGTDGTGITPPAGGAGIRGWLSGIFNLLGGTLKVLLQNGTGKNSSGTGQFTPIADASADIDCGAAATQTIVAGVANKSIIVCSISWISNGQGTIQFFAGATPLGGAMAVTPQTGLSCGCGVGLILNVPVGQDLKVTTTGSATCQGSLSYYQA